MGGKSSSQANQTSNTTNLDKRFVNESGLAISAEGSSISLQMLDEAIVSEALRTVQYSDALTAGGFDKMLSLVDSVTSKTHSTAENLANTAAGMAGSYSDDVMKGVASTVSEREGRFDQQTIVILATVAVAGMVFYSRKK